MRLFVFFFDFWALRRHFGTVLGPKTGPRSIDFRCFFEKRDFLKIVLPLWWEHNFEGSDAQKIGPESDSKRQRRKN